MGNEGTSVVCSASSGTGAARGGGAKITFRFFPTTLGTDGAYVLLSESRRLAEEAGDVPAACSAAALLGIRYVDGDDLLLQALDSEPEGDVRDRIRKVIARERLDETMICDQS